MYEDNMKTMVSKHSFSDMLPRNKVSFLLSDDKNTLKIEMTSYKQLRSSMEDTSFVILEKSDENDVLFRAVEEIIKNK